MAVASQKEIDKVQEKLNKLLKKLNPDGSPKRKMDDNLAKGLFRDSTRKRWMAADNKVAFLLLKRIPDMDNSTRTKWLQRCNKCGMLFKEGDVNIDHRVGEKQFVEWGQAQQYASSILDVTFDDLQILCIKDHATKTRCEALGLDWRSEEGWRLGLLEQEFTKIMTNAKTQKAYLSSCSIVPAKNELQRKEQIREVLFK